jgi:hypothetical protein
VELIEMGAADAAPIAEELAAQPHISRKPGEYTDGAALRDEDYSAVQRRPLCLTFDALVVSASEACIEKWIST